jgi:hypothetical protein
MEKGYRVVVDDNYHYMDEDSRWVKGEYTTFEEALAVARKMVEDFFHDRNRRHTAKQLYDAFTMMGDDPWIESFGGAAQPPEKFSAWAYAKEYTKRLCQRGKSKKEKKHDR